MEWWSVHWLGWQSSMLICFVVFQPMSLPQLMGLTLAEIDAMTRSMGKIFTGTAGKLSLVRFVISRWAAFYVYHLAFYDKSTSLRVSLYSKKWDWCYLCFIKIRAIKICSRPISKIDNENRSLQIHHMGSCKDWSCHLTWEKPRHIHQHDYNKKSTQMIPKCRQIYDAWILWVCSSLCIQVWHQINKEVNCNHLHI